MERHLVSIQRIDKLEPILGADAIERASVLGWHLVVKKGEFREQDLCVFCEVDSVLPERPEFEFLRTRGFRIKTIKLRQQVSQGIAFPLSVLPQGSLVEVGQDVTEVLGVKKYEPQIPAQLSGKVKGNFPSFLHKTDEIRIQSVPKVLERHRDKTFYIAEKVDGSSLTVFYRTQESLTGGEFGVCSRNLELKEDLEYGPSKNSFWKIARDLDLENKLKSLGGSWAVQGELLGPGIQKNKYHLSALQLKVFNIFDIQQGRYLNYLAFKEMCARLTLDMVPIVSENYTLKDTVDTLVDMSKGISLLSQQTQREGLVFRPIVEDIDSELGRTSFKVLNPNFLLKYDE